MIKIKITFTARVPSIPTFPWSTLCFSNWNSRLPLQRWQSSRRHCWVPIRLPLLLWSMWIWRNHLRPWLHHWIWTLAVSVCVSLSFWGLWYRGWDFLFFQFSCLYTTHRNSYLNKLSQRLPPQPRENRVHKSCKWEDLEAGVHPFCSSILAWAGLQLPVWLR